LKIPTLNRRDLKDLICENVVLQEFAPYGCDQSPGKIHGFNPFSKKCIDITDYQGPSRPTRSSKATTSLKKRKTIRDASPGDVAEAIVDGLLDAWNLNEIEKCIKNNKWASLLGFLLNNEVRGVFSIMARAGLATVTGSGRVTGVLDSRGKALANDVGKQILVAETESAKRMSKLKKSYDYLKGIKGTLWRFLKFKGKATKWAILLAPVAIYGTGMALQEMNPTIGRYTKPVINLSQFLKETILDIELRSIGCFFTAVLLTHSVKAVLKNGVPFTYKLASEGSKQIARSVLIKIMKRKIGKLKTPELEKFAALSFSRRKITMDSAGKLIITPPSTGVLEITSASPQFSKVAKYAVDEKVTINFDLINTELDTIGKEVSEIIKKDLTNDITTFRQSNIAKSFRSIVKLGPELGQSTIRNQAYSGATRSLKLLMDSSEDAIKQFAEIANKTDVMRQSIPKSIRNSSTFIDLQRAAANSTDSIETILSSSGVTRLSPDNKKFTIEYLEAFRATKALERNLIQDLAKASVVFDEKLNLIKNYFPSGQPQKGLKEFLRTGKGFADAAAAKSVLNLSSWSRQTKTFLKGFKDAQIAFERLFGLGTFIAATPAVVVGFQAIKKYLFTKEQKDIIRNTVQKMLQEVQITNFVKTGDQDSIEIEIDVSKLFSEFNSRIKKTELDDEGKEIIERYNQEIQNKNSTIYKIVDQEMNGEEQALSEVEMGINFQAIVESMLENPDELPKRSAKSKSIKKDKDIIESLPNGEMVGAPATTINLSGENIAVKFNKDSIQLNNKRFMFLKPVFGSEVAGTFRSVRKSGQVVKVTLVASILGKEVSEEYKLDNNEITDLFLKAKPLNSGGRIKVRLDGKEGIIRRIKDSQMQEMKRGVKIMNKNSIKDLIKQVIEENSGMGYSKYPYAEMGDHKEPMDDYIEEWKALSMEVIRDESRNTAIAIAKILVKDLELFEDVLDLAGQNQSVGTEILNKLKDSRENS